MIKVIVNSISIRTKIIGENWLLQPVMALATCREEHLMIFADSGKEFSENTKTVLVIF
jgi:hypothetical protein